MNLFAVLEPKVDKVRFGRLLHDLSGDKAPGSGSFAPARTAYQLLEQTHAFPISDYVQGEAKEVRFCRQVRIKPYISSASSV